MKIDGLADSMNDNSTPHSASDYDREILKTVPFYHFFHTETIDLVRKLLPDVSVWLDTGCGTGYLAEHALPLFPKTHFLLADPAQPMLEQARARLAHAPSTRIKFIGAFPSEELAGVVAETPQVITAIQSHHYGGDSVRKRATDSCFRLLHKGGLYVTFENFRPETAQGIKTGLDRWCDFQVEAGRSEKAAEEHRARFEKNYFPITIAEHLKLLRATGFSAVEIFWVSHMQAGFYAIK
jgi:tRNA (cmo5U34)-methyltransferase